MENVEIQTIHKTINNIVYEIERTFNVEQDVKDIIENVVISNTK